MGSHQLFVGAVRVSSWCSWVVAVSSFVRQQQMSRIQGDCKTATLSYAIQGNFSQACRTTEALILLLIKSCMLDTSVPAFSHVEKSRGSFHSNRCQNTTLCANQTSSNLLFLDCIVLLVIWKKNAILFKTISAISFFLHPSFHIFAVFRVFFHLFPAFLSSQGLHS